MAIVSVNTRQAGRARLWQPFAALLDPPPRQALLYLGYLYPAEPRLGVNPLPELLSDLIEWLREAGAGQVTVAAKAAPGFEFAQSWQLAGYGALDSSGALCLDLAAAPVLVRESRLNLALRQIALPQALLAADCLINVAKFRVAEGLLFGSALTNLEALTGLPPQAEALPRALVDVLSIAAPDLHVLDATPGQRGWQPLAAEAFLSASDPVAMDMTLAAVAGLNGGEIEQLALAAQHGLGSATAGDIQLVGEAAALFGLEEQQKK